MSAIRKAGLFRRLGGDFDLGRLPRPHFSVEAIAAPVHPLGGRYGGVTEWIPVSWGWSATSAALHEYLGMLKP